jgi:hypothetical protein
MKETNMTRAFLALALVAGATAWGADVPERAPENYVIYDSLELRTSWMPYVRFFQSDPASAWYLFAGADGVTFLDATTAYYLPFHIDLGSPDYSQWVHQRGVCIGCYVSDSKLYVYSTDDGTANARMSVREASGVTASRNMLRILNQGAATFRFDNTATGASWGFGSLGSGKFFIGSTPGQPLGFTLTPGGDVTLTGTLTQMSDRAAKTGIEPVDAELLLARVSALPLASWSYLADPQASRHVGPMAQDFAAAFGLGADDRHVAPADLAGVGLAAVQALSRRLARREGELLELREALERARAESGVLATRLALIERTLRASGDGQ